MGMTDGYRRMSCCWRLICSRIRRKRMCFWPCGRAVGGIVGYRDHWGSGSRPSRSTPNRQLRPRGWSHWCQTQTSQVIQEKSSNKRDGFSSLFFFSFICTWMHFAKTPISQYYYTKYLARKSVSEARHSHLFYMSSAHRSLMAFHFSGGGVWV